MKIALAVGVVAIILVIGVITLLCLGRTVPTELWVMTGSTITGLVGNALPAASKPTKPNA